MSAKRKQIHGRNPSRGDKEGGLLPVRVGGRIKKAKTIFDPSESLYPKKRRMELIQPPKHIKKPDDLPKRKRKDSHSTSRMVVSNGEDSSSERKGLSFYQGWCLICLKNHPKLITCKTCSYKAHFECLDKRSGTKFEDLENNWHCPQCKFCTVCQKTADFGILIQCTRCYEFYHNTCHRPRIITKGNKRDRWICRYCRQENTSGVSSESGLDESASSGEATPVKRTSPDKDKKDDAKDTKGDGKSSPDQSVHDSSPETAEKTEKSIEKIDKKEKLEMVTSTLDPVPDASSWTAVEVYNYFLRHFPKEAEVFREQEIDGASLVLMKRDDVVSGLKLKLGPAIRIYRHVLMLQKRSSDPRLSWF